MAPSDEVTLKHRAPFWQLVIVLHMAQVLVLHQCQTGLSITLPGCRQILSVAKPNS